MSPATPRLWLASLSGRSDADWARAVADSVDGAMLGGIALDEPTRAAAREMVDRDRDEFLPPDPVAFIGDQLDGLSGVDLQPGFNVRAVEHEPLAAAAAVCAENGAVLEVNAHCRQDEMCAAGAGQALLADTEALRAQVATAADAGADVSVKLRTEVPGVDLPAVAAAAVDAGARYLHVDAMDSEGIVAQVVSRARTAAGASESGPAPEDVVVIANNGVRDAATTREYLAYGADAVSVGRASDEPAVLERVRATTREWFGTKPATTRHEAPGNDARMEARR